MWILCQYCDVGIDNEDEFLTEVNSIEEAIKYVENQCNIAYEQTKGTKYECVPLENFAKNIDYIKRNEHRNAFFKIEFIIDEDVEYTFIAVAGGDTTYFCERKMCREIE